MGIGANLVYVGAYLRFILDPRLRMNGRKVTQNRLEREARFGKLSETLPENVELITENAGSYALFRKHQYLGRSSANI